MKSPETRLSTISIILSILVSQINGWLSKIFAFYNILQYMCDFIHVLICIMFQNAEKVPN